jgi:predicted PurR-regulated permease PerM
MRSTGPLSTDKDEDTMRRLRTRDPSRRPDDEPAVEVAPHDLAGFFGASQWLRDLGTTAWLLVGVALATVGAVWLLSLTQTIVTPVITAGVIAAVSSPLVAWLARHRVGRGLGAALVLVALILVGAGVALVVLGGVTSQLDAVRSELSGARDTLAGWATDLGIDPDTAQTTDEDVASALSSALPALLEGIGGGLKSLSSLVVFLSFTALSLFFLLKDGPQIRRWAESHMRVPEAVAHGIGERLLQSLRGYFVGVTLVAGFNAVLVGVGALVLGVPLAGTIMAVTFVGAYVPYLGAWGAGAFSVLIALGGAGTDAAIGMIVVQLLANGVLQQLVQPIAYGAALGIHPLAVLVVTIAGGSLFGAVGLILAAPLASAATRIAADLARNSAGSREAEPAPGEA